jgi:hypothetical protein
VIGAQILTNVTGAGKPVYLGVYGENADSIWLAFSGATSITKYSISGTLSYLLFIGVIFI